MYISNNQDLDLFAKALKNLNIDILDFDYFSGGAEWQCRNICSPFSRLYFITDGEGYVENNYGRTYLVPGNVYLIPSYSTNNYICENHIEKFYFHFRAEFYIGFDIFEAVDRHISMPYDLEILRKLFERTPAIRPEDVFSIKAVLYEVVSRFAATIHLDLNGCSETMYICHDINKFIKDNCSILMTAKGIAEHFNMSGSALNKYYKKNAGITLKSFVDSMIIQTAKEKLVLTDKSIKEISYVLKFSDEFYFSKFFKKFAGMSPREYRATNKMQLVTSSRQPGT